MQISYNNGILLLVSGMLSNSMPLHVPWSFNRKKWLIIVDIVSDSGKLKFDSKN